MELTRILFLYKHLPSRKWRLEKEVDMDSIKNFLKNTFLSTGQIKRRDFIRFILAGSILTLFGKQVRAEKKPENNLKEAMFWRKLD